MKPSSECVYMLLPRTELAQLLERGFFENRCLRPALSQLEADDDDRLIVEYDGHLLRLFGAAA